MSTFLTPSVFLAEKPTNKQISPKISPRDSIGGLMKLLKLISAFLLVTSFMSAAQADEVELKISKILDRESFEDQTSRELMGVANGEILLFTATPSESLSVDCSSGKGKMNYTLYSAENAETKRSEFTFDSLEKCEAFAAMAQGQKESVGVESNITIGLNFGSGKIKSIHFSEGL